MLGNELTIRTGHTETVATFYPEDTRRLVIYHRGHTKEQVPDFPGFNVLVFDMPSETHDGLGAYDYPIRFFVEPVIVGINWCSMLKVWDEIRMVGFSGGGWTTHVVAALDRRVTRSYAIAGSLPPHLRDQHPGSYGDLEQRLTYGLEMDLYALAQNQTQILNRDDPCCFPGRLYDGYTAEGFSVLIEENDTHSIGPLAREEIIR